MSATTLSLMFGLTLTLLPGCGEREGDDPGECTDAADNDANGLFDCDDPGCSGSPDCGGDGTTPTDPNDTDTNNPTNPTDTDTDPTNTDDTPPDGERQPGPHEDEWNWITAWSLVEPHNQSTDYSANCEDTGGDWAAIFAPTTYDPTGYYYIFYKVETGGNQAVKQGCSDLDGDGTVELASECSDQSTIYNISGSTLIDESITVSDLGSGCNLVLTELVEIVDDGEYGEFRYGPIIEYTGSCYGADINNGCAVTHTIDLDFLKVAEPI
jgi:hypothetical protein